MHKSEADSDHISSIYRKTKNLTTIHTQLLKKSFYTLNSTFKKNKRRYKGKGKTIRRKADRLCDELPTFQPGKSPYFKPISLFLTLTSLILSLYIPGSCCWAYILFSLFTVSVPH